ncbi:MAG: LysR family transcriptional regulator [Mycobacteriales bacterium]
MITRVAGTGVAGAGGDDGPTTDAQLNLPSGVAVTADGGFLITDNSHHTVRKASAADVITRVADMGVAGAGRVELRHLRAFVVVAHQQSFTRAAERLMITQPALTRTIQQMETVLRVRLFDRDSRHVTLTSVGTSFLAQVERVLGDLDRAMNAVDQQVSIRLGFSWLLPDPWAQETVARFERTAASTVSLVRCDDPLSALHQHTIDVALVRGAVAPTSLRVVRLFDEPRVAVACSTRSELARIDVLDWRDVPQWPLVVNVVSGATGPWSWPAGQGPAKVVETTNFDEWMECVAANRGIGVVPEVVRRRISHPAITFVPLVNAPEIPVGLAYLPNVQEILLRRFIEVAVASVDQGHGPGLHSGRVHAGRTWTVHKRHYPSHRGEPRVADGPDAGQAVRRGERAL